MCIKQLDCKFEPEIRIFFSSKFMSSEEFTNTQTNINI